MDAETWELIAEMKGILEDLVYLEDDCRHDHHGYCQAHNLADREDCHVYRAKKVLAKIEEKMNDS